MQLTGFHHVTAITADAPGNYRFYTELLGMRLVKKTVNQDDVSAYHLFYADGLASPGSDLTFFDWPVPPERRGNGAITRIGLRVPGRDALDFWTQRFDERRVTHGPVVERDGHLVMDFEDPETQRLCLIADPGSAPHHPWLAGPVARDYQILGLGAIEISVARIEPTDQILRGLLGMDHVRSYRGARAQRIEVYAMDGGGETARELHVAVEPDLPSARQGSGGVHHLALRTPDEDSYNAWADRLRTFGIPSSGPVDRFYFRSLYFRDPNGILFEIATDGPGFAVDEPLATLGQRLALPPFLESRRQAIEAGLQPLST